MKKILLVSVVASYALLRIGIFANLPILKEGWEFYLSLGFINLILVYLVSRKYLGISSSLMSALVYASSPLVAYYEYSSSNYLLYLTGLLVAAWLFLTKWPVKFLAFSIVSVAIFAIFGGITLYSDPGVANGLNQLRGESIQNGYALISKIIENKYSYFGLHFLFNFINQFSPAVYFTPEYKILNFSFSPPVLLGFVFTTLIGLVYLGKNLKSLLPVCLVFALLVLPSALSKESPDLERLVIVIPLLALLSGYGFSKVSQFEYKLRKVIYLLLIALIVLQFGVTVFDIATGEPVRLMLLKS